VILTWRQPKDLAGARAKQEGKECLEARGTLDLFQECKSQSPTL
jgi:hypothetical protein